MPDAEGTTALFRRDAALAAIKQCSLHDEKVRVVKITLRDGEVVLSMSRMDGVRASAGFEANVSGEAEVGVNAAYLGGALEVMPEVVRMTLRDEGVAMTIEPDGGSGHDTGQPGGGQAALPRR